MIINNIYKAKRTKQFIFLCLIILTFLGCEKSIKEKSLKMKLVNKFKTKNIYVPIVCATKDKIFITNSATATDGKIYVYDYVGNLITRFGNSGKGPWEFSFIMNFFYNDKNNILGVYDLYSYSIKYFDDNYKFVKSKQTSKVFFDIIPFRDSYIYFYTYPKSDISPVLWYFVEMTMPNNSKKVIKEKKDQNSIYKKSLRVGANKKNLFVWDFNNDFFFIEQYNKNGDLEKKWYLNTSKRPSDIKEYHDILVGNNFLLLSYIDTDDNHFYEAYDFSEKYLGTIKMENSEDKIGYVYNDFIFYLKYHEEDDQEYYECKIYKIDL